MVANGRMRWTFGAFLMLSIIYYYFPPLSDPKILQQSTQTVLQVDTASFRAEQVREAFIHGWTGYQKHALPHDMLRPLSRTSLDLRAGWGEQAVDILSAAILMNFPDVVRSSVDHIKTIDWDVLGTDYPKVSIFGTTIRYLGSLVSAYDLFTTTNTYLVGKDNITEGEVSMLLEQSRRLADALSPSFETPTKIYHNQLYFPNHTITSGDINDITAISGLPLEWSRLSDLTKNQTYSELTVRSLKPLLLPHSEYAMKFPGLLPKHINTDTGLFDQSDEGGWSHAGGGLYEMLVKLPIYDSVSNRFSSCIEQWKIAADSTIKHLASHPRYRPELTFLAGFNGSTGDLIYYGDHSGMFAAASFILGASVTGDQRYLNFGLELLKSYIELYRSTKTGFGPESWSWTPDWCDPGHHKHKDNIQRHSEACKVEDALQRTFLEKHGWFPIDKSYKLRPEVVESLYYAYRVTNDTIYRDWSYEIFEKLMRHCKTDVAFAELKSVDVIPGPGENTNRGDYMHSWVLSETIFYAWAIQVGDAPWQVKANGKNEWVFTTQAHPIRVVSEDTAAMR